jgi:hypothetical protein
MFETLRAAWRAGRSGQAMPAKVDKSTGQTAAICGIAGISVLVVFSVAYGFGRVEKAAREAEALEKDTELKELEADAEAAKLEMTDVDGGVTTAEEEGEEGYVSPPGSAACPHCHAVHLDSDHAAECCPDKRGYEMDEEGAEEETTFNQDLETGEITDPAEDDPEPDDAMDLWEEHVGGLDDRDGVSPDQALEEDAEDEYYGRKD